MTATARLLMILAVVAAGAAGLALTRCEADPPEITLEGPIWVGRAPTEVAFRARDEGSGIRSLSVRLETAAGERPLLEIAGSGGILLGDRGDGSDDYAVTITAQGLPEGPGTLRVEAVDWSWRSVFAGNVASAEIPVTIDTKPPRVSVESGLTYVKRAGSAAVAYTLSEPVQRDGVVVGDVFFRGFPAEETGDRRVAVFAVPRDAPESPRIKVVATDLAGNEATRGWATELQEREFEKTPVRLPDRFFENTVPDLAGRLSVDAADVPSAFKEINERIRAENERRIHEVTSQANEPRHWIGSFSQLRNSKVTSRFAEFRRYMHGGAELSTAVHYGYDLASTARASVNAANAGRVVFADELGIYGLCVIVDHGLGITSLYGHLSQIDVAVGDLVEKDQTIGLSGATGLAGGDHLHFAILVGGVYVDPLEWWDGRWVRLRVEDRILGGVR